MIIDVSTATGTQAVWKQERLVLRVTFTAGQNVGVWTNLHGNYGSPLAIYVVPSTGVLNVDMTDYVRTYKSVTSISIYTSSEKQISVAVAGLINPAGVIIPPHDLEAYKALILPPTRIIWDGTQDGAEDFEFYATAGTWNVTGSASMSSNKRMIGQIAGDFTLTDGTHTKKFAPELMQPCARYVLVKWVSFSGITRRSWFEIKKPKSASADAYELLPIDNEYIEIKGRTDKLTLWLDNLDAYDLWYYGDVILSSDVQISLDGGATFDRVQVETKEIETPDFVANGKLEITVNWKRYDAVNL